MTGVPPDIWKHALRALRTTLSPYYCLNKSVNPSCRTHMTEALIRGRNPQEAHAKEKSSPSVGISTPQPASTRLVLVRPPREGGVLQSGCDLESRSGDKR